jgi:hypothetical protein
LILGVGFSAVPASAGEVDVSSCGTTVPAETTGVVQSDLDCTGGILAILQSRSTLDLNGHTVRGEIGAAASGRMAVVGPGTLIGRISGSDEANKLSVRQVDIVADSWGILASQSTLKAEDVTITGATFRAVEVRNARFSNVTISNNPVDKFAVFTANIRGEGVVADDNGTAGCTLCYALYATRAIKLRNLDATGNEGFGVFGVSWVKLFDSNVTGNNGGGLGIDVAADGNLVVDDTTCGLSGTGEPTPDPGYWGVCAND